MPSKKRATPVSLQPLDALETFRLDSPVVREILANLNREVAEGIRQKEKKGDD